MERHSFFKQVHKGIRALAADLVTAAGRTDFRSTPEVEALGRRVEEAFAAFEAHAAQEDAFILPLLRACAPDVAADCEADHRAQTLRLRDLRSALDLAAAGGAAAPALGHAFVLGLSRYDGEMLVHMADEEERLMPALWAAFDDEALHRHHRALLESLPASEKAATIRWVFPAISAAEQAELLAGMRAVAPPAALEAIVRAAREALSPEDWRRLAAEAQLAA